MKFGPVPLGQAEGGILAHSVSLPSGRLRKGRVLDADDVTALAKAGHKTLTLAQLEPSDLSEDAAATALAQALVPDPEAAGLILKPVGTGRVNIVAAGPGLVHLSVPQIHAVNSLHPAITVATLPDLMRVDPGAMVATVKIITYGVPAKAIASACQSGQGAVRILPPVMGSASLIQTSVDPSEDGCKGHTVTAARLARLGVALEPLCLVPHRIAPLAEALQRATGEIILILTGSATSDPQDTAPEALRRAGGNVAHFGMPVDPGNLLFIGSLRGCPVVGLPGCAKSPALNGADWVLERLLCGLAITPSDIMAMGVGGLLKEIPTRPRPRRQGEGGRAEAQTD